MADSTPERVRRWRPRAAAFVLAAVVALAGATASLFLLPPRSDRALPMVRLLEPAVGPTSAAAPVVVGLGRSVPVRGLVLHESPIAELRINGRRLTAEFADDRMTAEFTGFVDLTDLRGGDHFEIDVLSINGSRDARQFPARRALPGEIPGPPGFQDVVDGDRRQRWAVVVGAGSFSDGGIPELPGAERDARAVADFLRSPAAGMGGLPESHVRLLTGADATTRNVRSALTTFLRAATPKDLVVIYLAGRSAPDPDPRGSAYLLTHDAALADLPATALPLDHIQRAVREVYAANRVVLVDAGDALGRPLVRGAAARQGGLALLAADAEGRFARSLMNALSGAADADGDGIVRLDEVVAFVPARVALTTYDRYWPLARSGAITGAPVAEP